MRFSRSSRTADEELWGAYRQRFNEILGTEGSSINTAPEPPVVGRAAAEPVAQEPVRDREREAPAAPQVESRQAPAENTAVIAEPPPPKPVEPPADDAVSAAASRVAESLMEFWTSAVERADGRRREEEMRREAASSELKQVQEELAELRGVVEGQQRLVETQVAAALARLEQHLEALDKTIHVQAQTLDLLGSSGERMEQAQQAVQQRLDAQAGVVRELAGAVADHQRRWPQYRAALEKLRELTEAPGHPVHLPENL
ncbi:MAG: hypothetical protein IT159_11900 [Bryobacterales bacterium]|nr:hypothetical protein [Bryobacterales bacterium]